MPACLTHTQRKEPWVKECLDKLSLVEIPMATMKSGGKPEDASFRHMGARLSSQEILGVVGEALGVAPVELRRRRRGLPLRGIAARCLMKYGGLSQREVAHELGMGTGAAVCNQLSRLAGKLGEDRRLMRQVLRLDEQLASVRRARPDVHASDKRDKCIVKG